MIHPWFVAWAWWKLYGFPWDFRLWVAFIIHDWGYWGKPDIDGASGETHPEWAARVMGRLFGSNWDSFCRYHSRFLAKRDSKPYSRLCVADKLAIALQPRWWFLLATWMSGELSEYMIGKGARTPAGDKTPFQWYRDVQRYCRSWAMRHCKGVEDTWTGTVRDLILTKEEPPQN